MYWADAGAGKIQRASYPTPAPTPARRLADEGPRTELLCADVTGHRFLVAIGRRAVYLPFCPQCRSTGVKFVLDMYVQ